MHSLAAAYAELLVSKSQLAIEHAYRVHEQWPEKWVFWVHASNAARLGQGYRDIANRAKMFGRQDPKVNIFQLVHDWLCGSRQRWLLVLDNVDDARFLLICRLVAKDSQLMAPESLPGGCATSYPNPSAARF